MQLVQIRYKYIARLHGQTQKPSGLAKFAFSYSPVSEEEKKNMFPKGLGFDK